MSPQPTPRPSPKQAAHDRQTYIPPHVEAAMAKQMQQMMPAHMKKYVGPYMQQNVVNPGMSTTGQPTGHAPTYKPVTHLPRESHYVQYQGSTQAPPAEQSTSPPTDNFSPEQAYDFIVNPENPPKKSRFQLNGTSTAMRALIFSGGLLILLVGFVVIKGLLSGGSALPGFVTVTQDQQELLHLVDAASEKTDLTTANQNFIATANLSLATAQTDMINYLVKNGQKINKNQLNLKVSQSTDAQLLSASTAGTYNQTFKEVMKTKLNAYLSDLQQVYQETDGPIGQELLQNDFDEAKLLLTQLEDTKS